MKHNVYCSLCGAENYPLLKYCDNCGKILKTVRIAREPKYDEVDLFFTQNNKDKIINTMITPDIYDKIIDNIREIGLMNLKLNDNESCLFRMFKLTQQFSKLHYNKKEGVYGYYSCNNIYVDEKLTETEKVTTLIHELAHHLFSEIFEQLLMYIFNSKKSFLYEAFALFIVSGTPYHLIANEFLAYTTEGYFANNLLKDYASIISILQKNDLDMKAVESFYVFGKSIASDIIRILEVFIPEKFRQEIVELSVKDGVTPITNHELDNVEVISNPMEKVEVLKEMLVNAFDLFLKRPDMIKLINELVGQFKTTNP